MKRILGLLAGLLLAVPLIAADKPLVIESGQTKQLPAATSLQLSAPTTANATVNMPHGTAPTSPTNGDCWTTTSGLFCRINGATVGPYGAGGGGTITLTGDVTGSGTSSIATAIGTNKVTDTMLRQSAGLSVVGRSANTTGNVADIAAATDGQVLRRSGTAIGFGAIDISSAAAVTGGAWTSFTPTMVATAGTITTYSASGAYQQVGKTVFFRMLVTITNAGTSSGGNDISLPVTAASSRQACAGAEVGTTGKALACLVISTTNLRIRYYDATFAGGTGNQFQISGVYEAA